MFRLAVRNVTARFGRIFLTALAIIVSTAFLSGTFIFRDTLESSFDALFAKSFENVDVYVQSANSVETAFGFERRDSESIDAVARTRAVPGVRDAQALVSGDAVVIAKNGKPIQRTSRSTSGGTINSGELSVWKVVDGRRPTADDEVVLDTQTASDGKYRIGDTVKVNAEAGSRNFTLVGLAEYNDISTPGDATWALFDEQTAMNFVLKPGFIDAVLVQGDGTVTDAELARRVQSALDLAQGNDVSEALTGAQIIAQSQTEIEKGLGFFTIFLSIFSLIALGVGCFVIYNVFSITAAQRRSENALLRAIGASRRQVTRVMLAEAVAVGLLGSVVGLIAGAGLAVGIQHLLNAFGFGVPSRTLSITGSTVAITMAAGMATTLIAAIVPAVAAGRIAPVAAMNESAFEQTRSNTRRVVGAIGFLAVGVAAIIAVLRGADTILLGVAVVSIFVGVLLFGPIMANPIARLLGAPVQRLRGITGSMSRGNVQRNPRRTARTAAPVLIGVALVTGATVFAASIKQQLRDTIGEQFLGDYVINSTNGGSLSFSQSFIDHLNTLPQVGDATGLGFAPLQDADSGTSVFATTVNPQTAGGLLDYSFVQGSFADLTPDGILISTGEATRKHLALGSHVDLRVGGKDVSLTVDGIYASSDLAQARVVHRDLLDGTSVSNLAGFVFMTRAPGVSDHDFRAAVDLAIKGYGIGTLQDRNQFIDGRSDIIDRSLSFIYGLLALSVIIAIFGIVLTMLLAVYERRREIGLLRAVGMTRSQVRTTVRWESVLTSLYGAIVGVALGLVLGYVVIVALKDQGLSTYTIPVTAIGIIVVAAFVTGVLAAVIPAWRATKHDILQSISMGS
ncbi:MAG: ABC-type transport system, involved in lipoprotein release, permease component [Acidimicrobiales bacterium]|nr:ABC-type transport system, involved in lipoprotein release, permease component [Acidimicrobiales bacterium]